MMMLGHSQRNSSLLFHWTLRLARRVEKLVDLHLCSVSNLVLGKAYVGIALLLKVRKLLGRDE